MTGTERPEARPKEKRPVHVLRDRHGGITAELKAHFSEQQRIRKLLREELEGGPRTIPQLAVACGLDGSVVVWHVMAMRRYGLVSEGAEQNSYLLYALKETRKESP